MSKREMNGLRIGLSRVTSLVGFGIGLSAVFSYATGNPGVLIWASNKIPMALPPAVSICLLAIASLSLPAK